MNLDCVYDMNENNINYDYILERNLLE